MVNFFTSPAGLGTLGLGAIPAAAQKVAAAAFAVAGLKAAPETATALRDAVQQGDQRHQYLCKEQHHYSRINRWPAA